MLATLEQSGWSEAMWTSALPAASNSYTALRRHSRGITMGKACHSSSHVAAKLIMALTCIMVLTRLPHATVPWLLDPPDMLDLWDLSELTAARIQRHS